jgi:hypothetical protein
MDTSAAEESQIIRITRHIVDLTLSDADFEAIRSQHRTGAASDMDTSTAEESQSIMNSQGVARRRITNAEWIIRPQHRVGRNPVSNQRGNFK